MEEELSLDNILGADEIENLFVDDEETQETPPLPMRRPLKKRIKTRTKKKLLRLLM